MKNLLTNYKKLNLTGASFLLFSILAANFFNFVFNAYLGRTLNFTQYGLVNLLTSFLYLALIVINSLYGTVNHRVAFLSGKNDGQDFSFYKTLLKRTIIYSLVAAGIWIICSPFLASFFVVDSIFPVLSFAPILVFGVILAMMKGYLQGKMLFIFVGLSILVEALSKLLLAIGFVLLGFGEFVYLTLPLSVIIALLVAYIGIKKQNFKSVSSEKLNFPTKFFAAALISGLAGSVFLTLDVILAKHYLSQQEAGQYALLSLVGKMIFFFGTLFNGFILTYVSREEGLHKSSSKTFLYLLSFSIILVSLMFLVVGPFGYLVVPMLFGEKARVLIPYFTFYSLSISMFTIASTFLTYHLAKRNYIFPIVSIIFSLGMVIGISLLHKSIGQITQVIFAISSLNLIATLTLHFSTNLNFKFLDNKILEKNYE